MNWNGLELPDKNIYFQDEDSLIYCADCRDILPLIPDKSIDLVLTDPPYGITACEWDITPDLDKLWVELKRIGKDNCAYVFTASQPFATDLINSNRKWFKYEWVWNKDKAGNILSSKYQPMKVHEDILVFAKETPVFNKQMEGAKKENIRPSGKLYRNRDGIMGKRDWQHSEGRDNSKRNPKSIINISSVENECNNVNRVHPTQKPIALMEYLIKTYSNQNNLTLDPFLGSGTTAYCAKKLGRKCIGIEISEAYCAIAAKRLSQAVMKLS